MFKYPDRYFLFGQWEHTISLLDHDTLWHFPTIDTVADPLYPLAHIIIPKVLSTSFLLEITTETVYTEIDHVNLKENS